MALNIDSIKQLPQQIADFYRGIDWDWVRERAYQYVLLTRMHRPIGTLLLLWPTLWALWIAAEGVPSLKNLVIFCLGTYLMRSAGCAINDYADRNVDGFVSRTKERPLAVGAISAKEALWVFAGLTGCAFILVLFTNALTIALSFGGALLAVIYPFMKRYTYLPQIFLGAAFGWAVPMAFAAETASVPMVTWLIFAATVVWATIYDTMYAMVDRPDDLKIGVKSTAILFGEQDRLIIGILQLTMLLALLAVGAQAQMGWAYYLGLTVATGLGLYHQYLIRHRDGPNCFKAFLHNNWLGMAVFIGVVLDFAIR